MPGKSVLIFANPIAGRGRGQMIAGQIRDELINAGHRVELIFDHPTTAAQARINIGAAAAISVGGDGTLRSMVDRLLSAGIDLPPVLPIPLGTANLMSRHLGLSWSIAQTPKAVVATLRRNQIRRLDAARANGQLFLLMAGVGIDAQVVHLLDALRSGPIDLTSYLLPLAFTFAGFNFPSITVIVDNAAVINDQPAVAFVGNIKEYGTGFPILTRARPDDGLLDVCVIPCRDRRDLAEMLLLVGSGEHPLDENVIYLRGQKIRVESDQPVPVQLDGDSAGHTPLEIEVLPGAVPFLIPM